MTARSLLLCCGAFVALGAASLTPVVSPAIARTATVEPAIDDAPLAFPGSVREVGTLIVAAGETLTVQGPIEFRVAGEVRIDGRIVVDGVESTGRPNLTIKSLGPMTIGKNAVLQTLSFGIGTDGGSIRLYCAKAIELHGRLVPSSGLDALEVGQHGGDGGDIVIIAPTLRTSVDRIAASDGGDAGPAGTGGKGGSVELQAPVVWVGVESIKNTTIVAGSGGRGGDGVGDADRRQRDGGDGGDGGTAMWQSYRVPTWLDETGFINDPQAEARRASAVPDGADGEPGGNGGDGQPGVNAIGGAGGDGGHGCEGSREPELVNDMIRLIHPGQGGSGGHGGGARAGNGGDGGRGGSTYGLSADHPAFGEEGGHGGDGGNGGDAVAGDGGNPGLGGIWPFADFVPVRLKGQSTHSGHPGHAGHANSGSGGNGGNGGQGYGPAPSGGDPGAPGSTTAGLRGADSESIRRGQPIKRDVGQAMPGHTGHPGHNGRSLGDKPED